MRQAGWTLLASVAVGLTGCGAGSSPPPPEPALTASVEPNAPVASAPQPTIESGPQATPTAESTVPPGVADSHTGEKLTPGTVGEWTDEARTSALAAGYEVMQAFARPDEPHQQWWTDLEPLLSQQAAENYAWVDPANIPISNIAEPDRLEEVSPSIAQVHVETDEGTYVVTLSREGNGHDWRAEDIAPPGRSPA